MIMTRTVATLIGSIAVACAIGASVAAQTPKVVRPFQPPVDKRFFFFNLDPAEAVIKGAPYSGEVTTRVKLTMFDGTHLDQSVSAKVYRDSAGRTRREQAVIGLEALDPNPSVGSVVQIVDPVAHVMYTLNPGSKTAMRRLMVEPTQVAPKFRVEGRMIGQELGTRTIEGLTATGNRIVTTIPAAQAGTDRPIEIIDETWTSTELKVALQTLHHDPRTGDVEYTLTKISRQEPDASLFAVPAGYQIRMGPGLTFAFPLGALRIIEKRKE
jgi:hypothetical protein